jgi:hypothetical protein
MAQEMDKQKESRLCVICQVYFVFKWMMLIGYNRVHHITIRCCSFLLFSSKQNLIKLFSYCYFVGGRKKCGVVPLPSYVSVRILFAARRPPAVSALSPSYRAED